MRPMKKTQTMIKRDYSDEGDNKVDEGGESQFCDKSNIDLSSLK